MRGVAISRIRARSTGSSTLTGRYESTARLISRIRQARRSLNRQTSRTFGNMTVRRTFLTTFFNDVLEHLTIQCQVGDQPLEARVLFTQLPQFADLGRTEAAKALAPGVERRFGDAQLSRDLGDRRA